MKDIGRPKEFPGKDEDFQKWSKNTETFFAGAIKSEMILECSAEQVTEVTQELIDLDFWPTSTNVEKGRSAQSGLLAATGAPSTHVSHKL